MSIQKQLLSGDQARLEIDLDEMFGTLVPDSSEFRQAVGQAIIDRIRNRTLEGESRLNKSFKNYSEEYAESFEFKVYGKSKNEPNLKASGDMLNSMDIIEEKKNKIVIGWNDDVNPAKAHGHITGNVGVKRDFLGLPNDEYESIKRDIEERFPLQFGDIETQSSVGRVQDFLAGEVTVRENQTLGSIIRTFFDGEEDL